MNLKGEKEPLEIAGGNKALQRLLRAQRLYQALDERIQPLLPPEAKGKIQIACVDQNTLVIAAANAAWASRARLEAAKILATAAQLWPEKLSKTRVIVSPGLH
ncbi:MAG: DciA family protein [Wenzhouxiangella sp.]|jgi:hypothetical protein|nr:DciA family protein [Wenzhouxiangella sp.]